MTPPMDEITKDAILVMLRAAKRAALERQPKIAIALLVTAQRVHEEFIVTKRYN